MVPLPAQLEQRRRQHLQRVQERVQEQRLGLGLGLAREQAQAQAQRLGLGLGRGRVHQVPVFCRALAAHLAISARVFPKSRIS